MILRRPSYPDPRFLLGSTLAFVLPFGSYFALYPAALAQNSGNPAAIQPPPAQGPAGTGAPTASPAATLKQRDQELDAALARQRDSIENQAKLRIEITSLGQDRRKFNEQLIATAAHVREVQANIEATRARLGPLDEQERLVQKSLDERRTAIVEILAALQRVGRQPPPALVVRPEDALTAVRTAIALGAVLPEMRSEADALAGDLTELVRVRKEIADETQRLNGQLATLGREQLRMTLLIDERQKQQQTAEKALDTERRHALELARQVDSIKDLIAGLEASLDASTRAARDSDRAISGDATQPRLAALSDPGRLSPAVPFADMRGHMHLPVNGVRVREFGGSDGVGGTQKGLSIASQPGSEITAPCDGWVVYAGPFRSYGQLLILNAGGGYHVLLAGMERISVDLGQFVLTGEPVAAMGGGAQATAAAIPEPKQPVLYVEFRKDGAPIDPSPWWATNEGEKVRG